MSGRNVNNGIPPNTLRVASEGIEIGRSGLLTKASTLESKLVDLSEKLDVLDGALYGNRLGGDDKIETGKIFLDGASPSVESHIGECHRLIDLINDTLGDMIDKV